MNVLLVTYSFPPAAGVGVLRAFSLAKYLPGNGIHVEVLTARNAAAVGRDPGLLAELASGVVVHRTWTLDLPFGLRKAIKMRMAGGARGEKAGGSPMGRFIGYAKRLVGDLLLPDPQVGWLPFAVPAACRLVRSRRIDLVLVTVPPFSSVRLVTQMRRRFPALPIVLDFRDEWLTSTLDFVSFNKNERARAVGYKAESEAVGDASAVVCVTDAAVAELRKRYPLVPVERFCCIPNGFDRVPAASRAKDGDDGLTVLTYLGSVYGSTDPAPVVEAVLALPPEIRGRLRLRFIGHIETEAYRETLLRLGAQVEMIGFLPQAEALQYMESTTYLLLITHDPINVAAKLYDYLGSGVPVLAAVHPTGDVRRILDATKVGWAADIGDSAALRRLLIDAVERTPRLAAEFAPDAAAIAGYHRKPLAARYAALLRAIMGQA